MPLIDNFAHAGGFIAGILLGDIFHDSIPDLPGFHAAIPNPMLAHHRYISQASLESGVPAPCLRIDIIVPFRQLGDELSQPYPEPYTVLP